MTMLPQSALGELKFMPNLVQNYNVWIQYDYDSMLMVKTIPYLILLLS